MLFPVPSLSRGWHILGLCLGLQSGLAATVPSEPATADVPAQEWRQRLETDARAMHAAILANHPGPVDPQNPGFGALLDRGLLQALARAATTRDFGGYWWALREYQASFDDGHLQLATKPEWSPALPSRWPGFLTRYDGGRHVVAVTDAGRPELPPEGAQLLSCDSIDADTLAADLVGHFRGRWFLESQRAEHAGRLFVDAGNPWITLPRRCSFQHGGQVRDYTLAWRGLPAADLEKTLARTQVGAKAPIALRGTYGNRGLWISMGRFDGNPGSTGYAQLDALMQQLQWEPRLPGADFVVLDVRGNGGGSSHWSRQIATQLWGDTAVAAQKIGSDAVDWRASADNLKSIEDFRASLDTQASPDPQVVAWANTVTGGLKQALAADQPLWRQTDSDDEEEEEAIGTQAGRLKPGARVYVLADDACASACLDALDLWKALGAIQLGRTTSADTVYMEVRGHRLPSGLAGLGIPMKVYRGRPRGHNQPYAPDLAWTGRMDDELALEAWVLGLAGDDAKAGVAAAR